MSRWRAVDAERPSMHHDLAAASGSASRPMKPSERALHVEPLGWLASESTGASSGLTPVRLARPRSAIRSRGAHGSGARSLRQLFCAAWSRMTGKASELLKTVRLRPEAIGKDLGARE